VLNSFTPDPPAWGELNVRMHLRPMDTSRAGYGSSTGLPLSKVKPEVENEGLYRWSAGEVVPGLYEIEIDPFHLLRVVRVPVERPRSTCIEIGEPVAVVVRVLEEDSGRPASLEAVHWHPEYPKASSGGTFDVAEYDEEIGGYRFTAPTGRVSLSCWSNGPYQSHLQTHDVRVGSGEITVFLKRNP
jgi:hypothetical protein